MDDHAGDITIKKDEKKKLIRLISFIGLVCIFLSLYKGNFVGAMAVMSIPLILLYLIEILKNSSVLFYTVFVVNYVVLGLGRYVELSGISVIIDISILLQFTILLIHTVLRADVKWKNAANVLTLSLLIWFVYCFCEVANPDSIFQAWLLSRNMMYYGLAVAAIVALVIIDIKRLRIVVDLYAVLTFLAVLKALMQKFIGFDSYEQYWLDNGGATTHIISSGIRYFSFFTDAGNFGANMGGSAVFFGIIFFYDKQYLRKIADAALCLLSTYAMFMSGTRGAMVVPLAGLAFYAVTSKNFKALTLSGIGIVLIYVFFAFTTIGQSNDMIRRMRTAFHPGEDPSYLVRQTNKQRLAAFMKWHPFGEGLGLSGADHKDLGYRFTMTIPNDSWYVKVWVETGIVGLSLYLALLAVVAVKCAQIIMFKVKNRYLKGILLSMYACSMGIFVGAYGNPFLGQFPTLIIVNTFLGAIMVGPQIEAEMGKEKKQLNENKTWE